MNTLTNRVRPIILVTSVTWAGASRECSLTVNRTGKASSYRPRTHRASLRAGWERDFITIINILIKIKRYHSNKE